MSASSRPSDRVRRCSAGATTAPTQGDSTRPNPPPPIIAADELEGEPIPIEDDPAEGSVPGRTRITRVPGGGRHGHRRRWFVNDSRGSSR